MAAPPQNDLLTEKIIGFAIEVHRHLGPGLLESAYEECLAKELALRKLIVERQKPVPVVLRVSLPFMKPSSLPTCVFPAAA